MNREQEIFLAANGNEDFKKGAAWADKNPSSDLINLIAKCIAVELLHNDIDLMQEKFNNVHTIVDKVATTLKVKSL